jgi:hypothetical protein
MGFDWIELKLIELNRLDGMNWVEINWLPALDGPIRIAPFEVNARPSISKRRVVSWE